MASTNQTTHYELSQYVANDKPTYLVDYNGDMAKIDAGIYSADNLARTNETSIGTLSNLNTTVKSDLVSALNEVNTQVGLNTTAIGNNTTAIGDNTTAIGTLANLSTTVKTDLVSATNEVNSKVGTLSNLTTSEKGSTVEAINEVNYNLGLFNLTSFNDVSTNVTITGNGTLQNSTIYVATNDNKSLAKIYGQIQVKSNGDAGKVVIPSSLNPSQDLTIYGICLRELFYGTTLDNNIIDLIPITIKTNGNIEADYTFYSAGTDVSRLIFMASLLYIKDFGDDPVPPTPPII